MTAYNVKVCPGARRNQVSADGDGVKVWTTAKPADGAANAAVVKSLAEYFDVPKSRVKIIRGEKSRTKIVEIDT
jgi:uncharacterized protein (TIGR00251 family)